MTQPSTHDDAHRVAGIPARWDADPDPVQHFAFALGTAADTTAPAADHLRLANETADRYRDLAETGTAAVEGLAATLAVYGAARHAQYARELAARLRTSLAEVAGGPRA